MSRLPNNFQFSEDSLRKMGYNDQEIANGSHGLNVEPAGNEDDSLYTPESESDTYAEQDPSAAEDDRQVSAPIPRREMHYDQGYDQDGPVYEGDEAPVRRQQQVTQQTPDPNAWIDQDTTELASAYGITPDQLSSFGTKDEFDAYRQMMDSQYQQPQMGWPQSQYPQPQFPQPLPMPGWPQQPPLPPQQVGWPASPSPGWPQPQSPFNYQQGSLPLGMQQAYTQQYPQPSQAPSPTSQDGDTPAAKDGEGLKDGLPDLEYYRKLYQEQGFEEDYIPVMLKPWEYARAQQIEMNQLKDQFKAVQGSLMQAAEANRMDAVHDALDRLDSQYYGNSLDSNGQAVMLNRLQSARRWQVLQNVNMLQQQMPWVNIQTLVTRADAMASTQRAATARSMQNRNNLVRQTGRIRPVGTPAGNPSARMPERQRRAEQEPITRSSQINDLVNDPEISELYNSYRYG